MTPRRATASLFIIFLLLIGGFFAVITMIPINGRATTLYVGGVGPGNYTTISAAINASSPGDTVYVYSGTYIEGLWIDKPLSLVGENKDTTIINGNAWLMASWVNITGFTITSTGSYEAIVGYAVDNLTINNNIIASVGYGIHLESSNNNTVINNTVASSSYTSDIYILSSSGNVVSSNIVSGTWGHIEVSQMSNFNLIEDNTANGGVSLWNTKNNTIADNVASNGGIEVVSSANTTVIRNEVSKGRGIWLWCSSYSDRCVSGNLIADNNVSSSQYGIYLNASNNVVVGNTLSDNDRNGIVVPWPDQGGNRIFHNNIMNNSVQAADCNLTNSWDDGYPSGGNYWSDYNGTDIYSGPNQNLPGSDGIGDTPYDISGIGNKDRFPLMKPDDHLHLMPGHRFMSFPVVVTDDNIESVLSSISGCYDYVRWYNPLDTASHWKSYVPGRSHNSLLRLDNTMGFWINITSICSFIPGGTKPSSTTIDLRQGWNMVGFPSFNTSYTVADLKADLGLAGVIVEAFDSDSTPYNLQRVDDSCVMKAGEGYWIFVPSDATWTMDR